MSKSCREELFSHFRRKCLLTVGSAWKMASGMALGDKGHSAHQCTVFYVEIEIQHRFCNLLSFKAFLYKLYPTYVYCI